MSRSFLPPPRPLPSPPRPARLSLSPHSLFYPPSVGPIMSRGFDSHSIPISPSEARTNDTTSDSPASQRLQKTRVPRVPLYFVFDNETRKPSPNTARQYSICVHTVGIVRAPLLFNLTRVSMCVLRQSRTGCSKSKWLVQCSDSCKLQLAHVSYRLQRPA